MALGDDLEAEVKKIFRETWSTREGRSVPEPEDIKLGNEAVQFDRATVLYADLSASTDLVNTKTWGFAAEVYKSYLYCAAKLVRSEGGVITSYDGDRIMGVFIGGTQSTSATRCGLKLNHVVQRVINPALKAQYSKSTYGIKQVVGIDTSKIRAARTGVRGGNDIVWIGRAANYAAKLTEINAAERTWITKDVYDWINEDVKKGGQKKLSMWKLYSWPDRDNLSIYGSTWTWKI